jgi:2-polyprenyl-3-methyl-5-hydroxy-6-metoxy-1,4-benzoquinol methylase
VDRTFSYVRCTSCGARYLANRPTASSVGHFYAADYAPYAVQPDLKSLGDPALAGRPGTPTGELHRRLIETYSARGSGGRLLDFGCGSPAVLEAAKQSGWDTVGADFSPHVVANIEGAGHTAVLVDDDVWDKLPTGSFDVVRLNHVVEHLYDPRAVLQHLIALLKPGGRLHLATPNPAGGAARMFGRHWWGLETPRHIVLFPPQTLRALVLDAGASSADVVHEFVTKDMTRSLSYAVRRTLRADDTQLGDGSRLVNRAAAPLAGLLARSGHADRYHVFAVR